MAALTPAEIRSRYLEGLLCRDGEMCAADLQRAFGISRQVASAAVGRYMRKSIGVRYSGPAKRYVCLAGFRPVLMAREDASLYADMIDIMLDIHRGD